MHRATVTLSGVEAPHWQSASGRGLNFRGLGPRRPGAAVARGPDHRPAASGLRREETSMPQCVRRRCRRQPERQCQWPAPGAPARGADFGRYDRRAISPQLDSEAESPRLPDSHWSASLSERPGHWHWQVVSLAGQVRVRVAGRYTSRPRSEGQVPFYILLGQDMRVRYITRPGGQVCYSARI